jgi:hypothetical protein
MGAMNIPNEQLVDAANPAYLARREQNRKRKECSLVRFLRQGWHRNGLGERSKASVPFYAACAKALFPKSHGSLPKQNSESVSFEPLIAEPG